MKTLKELLLEKGLKECEVGNHESDLYCKVCPESVEAIAEFEAMIGCSTGKTTFHNQITKELWYDIPFGFMPEHYYAKMNDK